MSETRKDAGREVFPGGDPFRATPPAAETGEPVAWAVTYAGEPMTQDGVFRTEAKAQREKARRDAKYGYAENRGIIPLYAAPAPREVSEAMVERVARVIHRLEAQADGRLDETWEQAHWTSRESALDAARAALSAETGTP